MLNVATLEPRKVLAANRAGRSWAPKKAAIRPLGRAPLTWIFLPSCEFAAARRSAIFLAVRCQRRRAMVVLWCEELSTLGMIRRADALVEGFLFLVVTSKKIAI